MCCFCGRTARGVEHDGHSVAVRQEAFVATDDPGARPLHLRSAETFSDDEVAALREVLEDRDLHAVGGPDQDQLELDLALPRVEAGTSGDSARGSPRRRRMVRSGTDRSLLFQVTRSGPHRTKDPPTLWWLPWVAIDFPIHVARRVLAAMSSGGEAKGHAKVRSHMLNAAATAMLGILLAALVYWSLRIAIEPASVTKGVRSIGESISGGLRDLWGSASIIVRIALAVVLTTLPVGAVARRALSKRVTPEEPPA